MPASTQFPGLLRTLTVSEFRLRDQGTLLGFLWTLLHPLLLFVVLRAVFGAGSEGRLLTGIVLWNFFAHATAFGLTALERRKGLVLWMNVPRGMLVGAAVGSVAISFLMETALLLLVLAFLGHPPTASLSLLPAVLLLEVLLALGASLALAGLHVHARDVERVWGLVLLAGFFLTPVFYAAGPGMPWLRFNPMAAALACGRQALLGQVASGLDWGMLAASSLLSVAMGSLLFRRLSRDAAERL